MNVKDGVRALKNEIRNYRFYQKQYDEIKDRIEDMWYEIAGVKGVDPSKLTLENKNQNLSEARRLELLDKVERFEGEKGRIEKQIQHIDEVVGQVEEDMKGPIMDIYIKGKTFFYTATKYNLYPSYLEYRIDKNLADIIKKRGGI